MEKVYILDTTLRDGAQSPLVSFTPQEKVEMAKALDALNVDVIDCGYPALNKEERESVELIAEAVKRPVLSVLSKCDEKEIEAAKESLRNAQKKRIHLYAPTSEVQLTYLAGLSHKEQLDKVLKSIESAKSDGFEVELTLEDSFRAEKEYLLELAEKAVEKGADIINISDTVGIAIPSMVKELISELKAVVKDKAILSIHCHDDLGMATANTMAALEAGARQAHLTLAGVGTRAGNAALEEIAVALKIHGERLGLFTELNLKGLYKTTRIFAKITGYTIPPHKAVVGDSAFTHKVEYMKLAVVRESRTFEVIDPEEVGYPKTRIVLSRYSGKIMFKNKVEELGYQLDDEKLEMAFRKFKELTQKKTEVYDGDIIAIIEDVLLTKPKKVILKSYSIRTGSDEKPEATVVLLVEGEEKRAYSSGDGPVDAAFKAIDEAIGMSGRLLDYRITSVTSGKDALGEVFLKVKFKGKEYTGRAIATDILQASIEAYLNAVNKAL
ncbi:MAG: 2-isopropylmalate synthase [Deferribacteres bacterium]|nr:2-isopropylmalate synthase [Deferribacteres bacterium]